MTPELIFLVQALAILVLPVAVWHVLCLRGRVPLVVVQILVGVALGPTLFGRFAQITERKGLPNGPGAPEPCAIAQAGNEPSP